MKKTDTVSRGDLSLAAVWLEQGSDTDEVHPEGAGSCSRRPQLRSQRGDRRASEPGHFNRLSRGAGWRWGSDGRVAEGVPRRRLAYRQRRRRTPRECTFMPSKKKGSSVVAFRCFRRGKLQPLHPTILGDLGFILDLRVVACGQRAGVAEGVPRRRLA